MFTFNKSIEILVLVVFGGMGSITGSVIAAIVIGFINIFLQSFSDIRMIVYGLSLVCIMIFRPGGLLGTKEFSYSALYKKLTSKGASK
jgi:branched-chain amino acid transport system permease protein